MNRGTTRGRGLCLDGNTSQPSLSTRLPRPNGSRRSLDSVLKECAIMCVKTSADPMRQTCRLVVDSAHFAPNYRAPAKLLSIFITPCPTSTSSSNYTTTDWVRFVISCLCQVTPSCGRSVPQKRDGRRSRTPYNLQYMGGTTRGQLTETGGYHG